MFGKKDAKSKSSKASKQRGVEAGREMADCGSKTTRDSKTSRSSKQFSTKTKEGRLTCLLLFFIL